MALNGTNYIPYLADNDGNALISAGDTASIDAFGRWRTSSTGQRLDVEFIYGKQEDFFDELTNNGTVTFNPASRDLTLSILDSNNGTYSWMSSHPVPYTPGNSQLIEITAALNLSNISGGVTQCFLRSSVTGTTTEEVIEQSAWGSYTSGLDWADSHIFVIDFQSLKVGRIRYGLSTAGNTVKVCEITNDNIRNTGYWQQASLPGYFKVYNDSTYTYMEVGYGNNQNAVGFRYRIAANASATMRAICCSIKSEGGVDLNDMPGLPKCIDNDLTPVTVSTVTIPIISIRAKSTYNSLDNLVIAVLKSVGVWATESVKLQLVHNATLTGASWTDVDTNESAFEYDVSATAYSGGHVVNCDYNLVQPGGAPASKSPQSVSNVLGKTVLWNRLDSLSGTITIVGVRYGSSDSDCLGTIKWVEIR